MAQLAATKLLHWTSAKSRSRSRPLIMAAKVSWPNGRVQLSVARMCEIASSRNNTPHLAKWEVITEPGMEFMSLMKGDLHSAVYALLLSRCTFTEIFWSGSDWHFGAIKELSTKTECHDFEQALAKPWKLLGWSFLFALYLSVIFYCDQRTRTTFR